MMPCTTHDVHQPTGTIISMPVEVKVLSSLATREAYLELVPQFERETGHKIVTTWSGTTDIAKRLTAGEIHDLVITSSTSQNELIEQGKIVGASLTPLARCGVGMAVRAGLPRPDVGTADTFKQAMLAANTVGYSTGPSGVYVAKLFESLGIADAMKPKTRQVPSGMTVGPFVAKGEADIGFQQESELVHVPGIDYIGALPPELQNVTIFSAGIHTQAAHPDEAKALLQFLTTPVAAAVMKKHGLQPG
jgi:molybdate transport system substrate-binding protein